MFNCVAFFVSYSLNGSEGVAQKESLIPLFNIFSLKWFRAYDAATDAGGKPLKGLCACAWLGSCAGCCDLVLVDSEHFKEFH